MTQQTDFSMMPQPGEVIAGRYEITALIGRGGGGVVYRATQLGINRDVAVKVLPPEHQLHAAAVRRFEREARLVSRLRHPNTVTLYEYNRTQSGLLYIVMEYVDGVPLKDVLQQQRIIPPERAVPVLRQILKSLAEAHSHGIVHRDLKPANIMLCNMYGEPDFVKVLDFGVATALEGDEATKFDEDVTTTADVVGTPRYMAPEQFRSEQLTPASDLYALACIGFEMLAGYCPFDGETLHVTIAKHLFQPPPKLPVELERFPILVGLIDQLLSKKPAERQQRAEEVLQTLDNWDGIPGDRTIKAPSPHELLSLIEQHQQQMKGGGAGHAHAHYPVDDYTGPVPPGQGQHHHTFTGYPNAHTPNQPLGPNTHHGLVLDAPDASGSSDRKRVILATAIGVLTLVALAVFVGIRLSSDDDSSNTAEASPEPEVVEDAPVDLGDGPEPSPLLDEDALERSVRLHDIGSRIGGGGHLSAVSGALMTPELARAGADEAEADEEKRSPTPQPRSNNVSFKVRYEPPSAAVRVNGETAECTGGKCRLRGKIGETFEIKILSMGFKPYKKTVTLERGMRDMRVKLEPMR